MDKMMDIASFGNNVPVGFARFLADFVKLLTSINCVSVAMLIELKQERPK